MRSIILYLCCLLTGCTIYVTTPPPTPTPPSPEHAELLYRALYLQATTKDVFMEAATAKNLRGEEMMGMTLLTIGLMQASYVALNREYPEIFQEYVLLAQQQYADLRAVGERWLQHGTLPTTQVADTLAPLDANTTLKAYSQWLIEHGYSYDDVEMMGVRFRADLAKTLAPTPQSSSSP